MGQDLERPLELRVRVLDINDNPPVFSMSTFVGQIEENSNASKLSILLRKQEYIGFQIIVNSQATRG